MGGSNFPTENITIRLNIEDSIQQARSLSAAILDVNKNVQNLGTSVSSMRNALATSFDLAIANARTLNATLSDTIRLQGLAGAAGGGSPRGVSSPYVDIYRGVAGTLDPEGINRSWTTDRNMAERFARGRRTNDQESYSILRARISQEEYEKYRIKYGEKQDWPTMADNAMEKEVLFPEGYKGRYDTSSPFQANRSTGLLQPARMPYDSASRFNRLAGSANDTSGYGAIADQLPDSLRTDRATSSLREQNNVLGQTRNAAQQTKSGFESLGESIQRTAMHVVTGIAVWESFRMVQGTITETTQRMLELEKVSARIASMSGQSRQAVSQQITTQAIIAAGLYGVSPDETIQNSLLERQLGATGADIQLARQMSVAYGEPYENILPEIVQSKVRMKQAGVGGVDVGNFYDAISRSASGTFEQKMDALQKGAIYGNTFGLSPQQAAVAMLRSGALTEAPQMDTVADNMARMAGRIVDPNAKQAAQLKMFDIEGDGGERVRNFAKKYVEILTDESGRGGRDAAIAFLEPFITGLNQGKERGDFGTYLEQIVTAAKDGSVEVGNFNKTLQDQMSTTSISLEKLKSAWDTFLLSFTNTSGVQTFFKVLIDGLTSAQQLMTMDSLRNQYEKETGKEPSTLEKTVTAAKFAVNPVLGLADLAISKVMPLVARGLGIKDEDYDAWLAKQNTGGTIGTPLIDTINAPGGSYRNWRRKEMGASLGDMDIGEMLGEYLGHGGDTGTGRTTKYGSRERGLAPAFGGFTRPDEKMNLDALQAKAQEWDERLRVGAAAAGQEAPKMVTTEFWDESKKMWRPIVASMDALRFATDDLNKTQKEISGVFNVPAGGEAMVVFRALTEKFVPSDRVPPKNNNLTSGVSGGASGNMRGAAENISSPINISNNINVLLDGKSISHYLDQQLFTTTQALSAGGAGGLGDR